MSSTTLTPPVAEPDVVDPTAAPDRDSGARTAPPRRALGHPLWRGPERDPAWAAPTVPAAGPERTVQAALRAAAEAVISPPLERTLLREWLLDPPALGIAGSE